MIAILLVILGLAFVIGFHEFCHMLVAKYFNVKVNTFALGFGPILLAKKIGETSYELRLLPLGGFVQCHGEDPSKNVKRGFFSISWWKRSLIALAGPVANLFLGFSMLFILLLCLKWTPVEALERAGKISYLVLSETLKALYGLVVHTHTKSSAFSGPIGVSKVLINSAKESFSVFTGILSLVSLSLGLFNILPIPGLDGAHILLYFIEGIYGKKLPNKVYEIWNIAGLILLVSIMVFACFMDLK